MLALLFCKGIELKGSVNTVGELDWQTLAACAAANLAVVHKDSDSVPSALLAAPPKLIVTRSDAMPAASETAFVIFDLTVSETFSLEIGIENTKVTKTADVQDAVLFEPGGEKPRSVGHASRP